MNQYNIAVVGASGIVGKETIKILHERKFPVNKIYPVGSNNSLGKKVDFGSKILDVETLDTVNFEDIDIVFSCAGSDVSKQFVDKATDKGVIVIDKTSLFRMDKDVPLIIPEINSKEIVNYRNKNIISNPNCCVIPIAIVLNVLNDLFKITRVVLSTYQSVSGAGKRAMDELYNQTRDKITYQEINPQVLEKEIAFNIIPKIGEIDSNGISDEEVKIIQELQRLINPELFISVTCVRIPVFIGHSISINVEFNGMFSFNDIRERLYNSKVIKLIENECVTPMEVVGKDKVFVSRLRQDLSRPNSINMWIMVDNLRKGAALNGVQIAENLVKNL